MAFLLLLLLIAAYADFGRCDLFGIPTAASSSNTSSDPIIKNLRSNQNLASSLQNRINETISMTSEDTGEAKAVAAKIANFNETWADLAEKAKTKLNLTGEVKDSIVGELNDLMVAFGSVEKLLESKVPEVRSVLKIRNETTNSKQERLKRYQKELEKLSKQLDALANSFKILQTTLVSKNKTSPISINNNGTSSNVSLILPAGTVNNTSVIGTGNATTGTIANVSDISNSNATIPGNLVNVLTMGSVVNNNTAASGTGKAAPATANKSRGALGKKR